MVVVLLLLSIIMKSNFKLAYEVKVDGEVLGYVNNKDEFSSLL